MKWRPTPEAELITARRMVGDGWEPCRFEELQPGDVFRAIAPDGSFVNPTTGLEDEACIALVLDPPRKLDPLGSDGQWYGYGVPIDLFPSVEELKRKGLS